ncbi:MAG TPA: thermostable hemolysin [Sphingomonadaceae bacterium]|nr:thermostable hemolysin [Sphingomonadaceae bacterium]
MPLTIDMSLIRRRYKDAFGASLAPSFRHYLAHGPESAAAAVLGYRRAEEGVLFLEAYLERPIEALLTETFHRPVSRRDVVEIGNFAADNAIAMIRLWGAAANDLAGGSEIAVATLTAPLRRMFNRIGVPLAEIALATPDALGASAAEWGRYYETDPRVCAGMIREGQGAISAFLTRRDRQEAA